ncbi:hypothetical protein BH23VER1_BH23VER1_22420 [soil metagenome]
MTAGIGGKWHLGRAEVARLLGTFRDGRYRAYFTTVYQCGLRMGEALAPEVPRPAPHVLEDAPQPRQAHPRRREGVEEGKIADIHISHRDRVGVSPLLNRPGFPKGEVPTSPELDGGTTAYPGTAANNESNPKGVVSSEGKIPDAHISQRDHVGVSAFRPQEEKALVV